VVSIDLVDLSRYAADDDGRFLEDGFFTVLPVSAFPNEDILPLAVTQLWHRRAEQRFAVEPKVQLLSVRHTALDAGAVDASAPLLCGLCRGDFLRVCAMPRRRA
jgi:hypothetical protein